MLQYSPRLEDPDLLEVAVEQEPTASACHCQSQELAEAITDVLVRQGRPGRGAQRCQEFGGAFIVNGFFTLVRKAEMDGIFAAEGRSARGYPRAVLRVLFMQAARCGAKAARRGRDARNPGQMRGSCPNSNDSGIGTAFPRDEAPDRVVSPGLRRQNRKLDETRARQIGRRGILRRDDAGSLRDFAKSRSKT